MTNTNYYGSRVLSHRNETALFLRLSSVDLMGGGATDVLICRWNKKMSFLFYVFLFCNFFSDRPTALKKLEKKPPIRKINRAWPYDYQYRASTDFW